MIIVTGATGQLGHAIVERLVERVPAHQVGVSVRDPAKARSLEALGVRVRRGDFEDGASLRHAFEGASQVLIVSSNARASGGDPLAQHARAIAAAIDAGVERIVYTSQMAASATSRFPPARDHAATEEMLRDSGLKWTALRHGFYASSGLMMVKTGLESGVIEGPQDGPVAWTAHADLARAAAVILADIAQGNGHLYEGPTSPLTGSQALDFAAIAEMATQVLGRPITRRVLLDEEMRATMAARGAPPGVAEIMLGYFIAAREGEFNAADPALERLIARPPISLRDLLAEVVSA